MHWFWRAVISVGVSLAIVFLFLYPLPSPVALTVRGIGYVMTFKFLPALWSTCLGVSVYAHLTAKYGPKAILEQETRCRKCGYILKGISEPRCSECWERI